MGSIHNFSIHISIIFIKIFKNFEFISLNKGAYTHYERMNSLVFSPRTHGEIAGVNFMCLAMFLIVLAHGMGIVK